MNRLFQCFTPWRNTKSILHEKKSLNLLKHEQKIPKSSHLEIGNTYVETMIKIGEEGKKEREKGSISPTFYAQLSRAQIPKAQKTDSLNVFFALLGSA